jgi:hypothetical protein
VPDELEPGGHLHPEDGPLLTVDVPGHEVTQATVVDGLVVVQVPGNYLFLIRDKKPLNFIFIKKTILLIYKLK